MGYSTEFMGELKFTHELTAKQLAAMKAMFGEDCREHPEWSAPGLFYINLKFNDPVRDKPRRSGRGRIARTA